MAIFTSFNDRLPDPTFDISVSGAQVATGTGNKGPGFASVTVRSQGDTQVFITKSGRGVPISTGYHVWEIDINYHPMPRDSFDVVQTFLEARNARFYPFYVVLPQYSKPKNALWAASVVSYSCKTAESKPAGSSYIRLDLNDGAITIAGGGTTGLPSIGDFINFDDSNDLNHQKAYKITRVETNGDYNSSVGAVSSGFVRIHISPALTRDVADNTAVRFINPTFRVITKSDVFEYTLSTDNLYQYSLSLEEVLA